MFFWFQQSERRCTQVRQIFFGIDPSTISARLLVIALITASALASGATQYLAVKGDRVNLRAAARADSEVVGQVSSTDTLILLGDIAEPWVKIIPPDNIDLWIYSSLVKDGKVAVNNAQVRSGAGLNFNVVGQLQRGDPVTNRGRVGDWLKIAPFPTAGVWITNAYVELKTPPPPPQPPKPLEPVVAKTADLTPQVETPPNELPVPPKPIADKILPAPADKVASNTEGRQSPPVIPAYPAYKTNRPPKRTLLGSQEKEISVGPAQVPSSRLRQDVQQAVSGSYAGALALVPFGTHPTAYRLVSFTSNNKPVTVCYVLGNSRQLDSLKGGYFTIEGAVYWFNSTALPTVFAQNILRHQRP